MADEIKMNLTIIVDGSDTESPLTITRSGAELRRLYVNKQRRDFLHENGEDFFQREGGQAEVNKRAQWVKEGNIKFPDEGDYIIPLEPGTENLYDVNKATFLGKI